MEVPALWPGRLQKLEGQHNWLSKMKTEGSDLQCEGQAVFYIHFKLFFFYFKVFIYMRFHYFLLI